MVATPQYKAPGRRVLASAPGGEVPLWGLTLEHSQFSQPSFWLVNRPYAVTAFLENGAAQTYEPAYFELQLPTMDGQGQQDAQISMQNIDRRIIDELERAAALPSERIQVTLRLFVETDLASGPQNVPMRLSFSALSANNIAVAGTAGRPDTLNRAFPTEVYRVDRWPGLDR